MCSALPTMRPSPPDKGPPSALASDSKKGPIEGSCLERRCLAAVTHPKIQAWIEDTPCASPNPFPSSADNMRWGTRRVGGFDHGHLRSSCASRPIRTGLDSPLLVTAQQTTFACTSKPPRKAHVSKKLGFADRKETPTHRETHAHRRGERERERGKETDMRARVEQGKEKRGGGENKRAALQGPRSKGPALES